MLLKTAAGAGERGGRRENREMAVEAPKGGPFF